MSALSAYYTAVGEGLPYTPIPLASSYTLVLTGQTDKVYDQYNLLDQVELYKATGAVFHLTSLVTDPSFEDHVITDPLVYQPVGTAWQYQAVTGLTQRERIGQRPSGFGEQNAFLYTDGNGVLGEIAQTLPLTPGIYYLRYAIAARDPGDYRQLYFKAVARLNNTEILNQDLPYAAIYQPYPFVQSLPFRIY